MAYIRKKRIKTKKGNVYEYAYVVENKWKKKKKTAKQKFKAYLGRIYVFQKVNDEEFSNFFNIEDINKYVKDKSKVDIINDIIKLELYNHGFRENDGLWVNNKISVDVDKAEFYIDKEVNNVNKKVVLALNEGFLCKEHIYKLMNFKSNFSDEETGYRLAKAFVEAGLKVPKDIFVGVFEKIS